MSFFSTPVSSCVAAVTLTLLGGCASEPARPKPGPITVIQPAPTTEVATYTLMIGDEVDIKVPDAPQYDQTARVRPDGKVSLNVVGTLHALGRTPDDVQIEVRERYQAAAGGSIQREYLLHTNDEIDIKFPYLPNLNELVRVRPDGKVQLQLVGTVQAEGLSPEALQAELKRRYGRVIRVPELSVLVRTATSQSVRTDRGVGRAGLAGLEPTVLVRSFQAPQVFVTGELAKPGMLSFLPGMTLMQALAQAGGQLPTGDIERLVVLRRTAAGAAEVLEPHLSAQYLYAPDKDVALQPFDVVLLPPTRVAVLGQSLDQYVFKLLPPLRNSSFGFVYDLRKTNN
ncbi:MAG: polysaccharide biosynthesis/export family protein [Aquabacterium sp.]|nr:polysaccharide biosynthesis/export family protein [Aquabacterium sp.]